MEKNDLNNLKEILNGIKNGSVPPSKPNFTTGVDFTPKKKPTLKVRFKKVVTNTINSIKKSKFLMKIKAWFNKTIAQPIKDKRAKKEHEKYIKQLKENFSKKFNVNVEKTIKIMNGPDYSPKNINNDDLLIQNRLEINKRKSLYKFGPFMYNPDVIEIHNENLNPNNPTLQEIITDENKKAWESVHKQYDFYKKRDIIEEKKVRY